LTIETAGWENALEPARAQGLPKISMKLLAKAHGPHPPDAVERAICDRWERGYPALGALFMQYGANLTGIVSPVPVAITIGDGSGTTSINIRMVCESLVKSSF
jgi:hypothetical protein